MQITSYLIFSRRLENPWRQSLLLFFSQAFLTPNAINICYLTSYLIGYLHQCKKAHKEASHGYCTFQLLNFSKRDQGWQEEVEEPGIDLKTGAPFQRAHYVSLLWPLGQPQYLEGKCWVQYFEKKLRRKYCVGFHRHV